MPNGLILRKLCVKCLCMYVLFYYKSLWNRLSVSLCHSVRVSASVRTISPEPFKHVLTKLGMAVYYHEAECTAGKKKKKKKDSLSSMSRSHLGFIESNCDYF